MKAYNARREPLIPCMYQYSVSVTFETLYFTYFGYLFSDRPGSSWRCPSVHAAILDTNTKQLDFFHTKIYSIHVYGGVREHLHPEYQLTLEPVSRIIT